MTYPRTKILGAKKGKEEKSMQTA